MKAIRSGIPALQRVNRAIAVPGRRRPGQLANRMRLMAYRAGTWLAEDGAMTTVVLDAEQGLLQAAWIERGAAGAELEAVTGTVRSGAGLVFFSVKDKGTEHGYQWLVIDHEADRVRAWFPDPEAFVAAVERGDIPGTAFEGSVILGELTEEQLARVALPESGLLQWREPLVLLRVGGG